MNMGRKILVVAPHMDDETLGMGGTIARHCDAGDSVSVCVVAHRIYDGKFDKAANDREKEHCRAAVKELGCQNIEFLDLNDERLDVAIQDIIKPIERLMAKVSPSLVYSNFHGDNNQDHRAVFQALRVVLRPYARHTATEWHLYEVPSSSDQSPPVLEAAFLPNYYVDISATFARKVAALACYETELRKPPHPRSREYLEALAVKRGGEMGLLKAEAFMMMRNVWR